MEQTPDYWLIALKLFGALALLIYGMKVMSEALQKMTGPQLRHVLGAMTTNRVTGMFTGLLLTVAVQSSSATTVMTVSFVDAGLLTLAQAISVIMGANIGTTLTAWIISAGTTLNILSLIWPLFLIGIVLIHMKRWRYVGDLLYGVAFLFASLGVLSVAGKELDLGNNETLIHFFASFDSGNYWTILFFLLVGTVLTCIVQSSAALMAITMVLCTTGVLSIYQGIALVMGENIGTTLTANLAALTGNTQARRSAMAHLLFNIFGVVWVLAVFYPFVGLACSLVGLDPNVAEQSPVRLSLALSAFHTLFNVTNTLLLLGFVPQMERAVCWIVQPREQQQKGVSHLRYIQGGLMKTPEISVLQAQKETSLFAQRMRRMFGMIEKLLSARKQEDFEHLFQRIEKYEGISDNMEAEIGHYLEQVSDAHLSDETKAKVRALIREISELESVGDACYNIARTLRRKREASEDFTEQQYADIRQMLHLTDRALEQICIVLSEKRESHSMQLTLQLEDDINAWRTELRLRNTRSVNDRLYSYSIGTIFMDIINECERLGDYVVNVGEARFGKAASPQTGMSSTSQTFYPSFRQPQPQSVTYGNLHLDFARKIASFEGKKLTLTKTEFELLYVMASNVGRIFSRQELIAVAWPQGVVVSARTVDVTVARLRKKLGVIADLLVTRSGYGYGFM